MDTKKTYDVAMDGTDVPCIAEYAYRHRKDDSAEVAAMLAAYLRAFNATNDEVEEALGKLNQRGYLTISENTPIAPDMENVKRFESSCDCVAAYGKLINHPSNLCKTCPAYARFNPAQYINANIDEEADLLAMMFCSALDKDVSEILDLGDAQTEKQGMSLSRLFASAFIVEDDNRLLPLHLHLLLFHALYLWCRSGMDPCVDGAKSMAQGAASILNGQTLPYFGTVNGIENLLLSPVVRTRLDIICEKIKYRDRINHQNAFRLLEECSCTIFASRKTEILGAAMSARAEEFTRVEPVVIDDDTPKPSEKDTTSDKKQTVQTKANAANTEPKDESAVKPDEPSPVKEDAPSEEAPQTEVTTVGTSEDAVSVAPINDAGTENEAAAPSLSETKTDSRSVDKEIRDRGIIITPLSSTGKPYSGVVGPDKLINPYVAYDEDILRPQDVDGLTPFALTISLESSTFYTVEYAICNGKEGFLCYIYKRNCTIFVSRSEEDWDYFNVILATFRRSIPKKLTMLAAPLIDFVVRMGERLHQGIIPVYDAYRLSKHFSPTANVKISDVLLPDTTTLASAIRQYGMIWKRSGLAENALADAVDVASVYASSNYAYAFTGNRYPHLYHDEVTYQLNWQTCQLRKGFLFVRLALDPSQLKQEEALACYQKLLSLLGFGSKHLLHQLRLLSCDAVNGFSYVVPLIQYPWSHNLLFIRIGSIARKLTGRNINVTEEVIGSVDGKQNLVRPPMTEEEAAEEERKRMIERGEADG